MKRIFKPRKLVKRRIRSRRRLKRKRSGGLFRVIKNLRSNGRSKGASSKSVLSDSDSSSSASWSIHPLPVRKKLTVESNVMPVSVHVSNDLRTKQSDSPTSRVFKPNSHSTPIFRHLRNNNNNNLDLKKSSTYKKGYKTGKQKSLKNSSAKRFDDQKAVNQSEYFYDETGNVLFEILPDSPEATRFA